MAESRMMRVQAEPSTEPADYAFCQRVRVRFADTDAMAVVHHSRYLPYLEEARVAYLRHIGHPYREQLATGVDSAVLECWVQYRAPLRFDELVDVHLRLDRLTRATFEIAYLLTVDDGGERTVRATAATVHGMITRDGRPTRLPQWLRDISGSTGPSGRVEPENA